MTEKLTTFDPAEYLETGTDRAQFITEALETGDSAFIAKALGIVARSQGMTTMAGETGIHRESLYRALSDQGNPTLRTILAVLSALEIKLTARAA
jgi:probable addiction module antidote protein